MFLVRTNQPGVAVDAKAILLKILVAAIGFAIIMFYLVPMLPDGQFKTIVHHGTILVAIFFILDLIF